MVNLQQTYCSESEVINSWYKANRISLVHVYISKYICGIYHGLKLIIFNKNTSYQSLLVIPIMVDKTLKQSKSIIKQKFVIYCTNVVIIPLQGYKMKQQGHLSFREYCIVP